MSCISPMHWHFSSHPKSFHCYFCLSRPSTAAGNWTHMTVGAEWVVGRWSALTLFKSEKRTQRQTCTKCPSLSLFYSSINSNTDSPRNNNTQAKEHCLSAHGVLLCHRVTVMFTPAWLVSVRVMLGADEWQCNCTNTHIRFNIQKNTEQGLLLTSLVPYRHLPLLLASNPT